MEISYEKEKQTSKDKKSSSILRRKSGSFKGVLKRYLYKECRTFGLENAFNFIDEN